MGYLQAFAVSAAGMDFERTRVDVATVNLSNANVVVSPSGSGYRPMRVIGRLDAPSGTFGATFDRLMQLPVATLEPQEPATRQALDPGHPMADANGMVNYPAVDNTVEMMTLMSAVRAYEANVAAMNASRTMTIKALAIGGAQ
jgi:flagellar basal-body rod protein FlgC